jgi:hypothetical protein
MTKIEKRESRKLAPGKRMDAENWVDPMCGPLVTGK